MKAYALDYLASMERSEWYVSSSIFECTIIHEIPQYGQGIFYHEAGEALRFYTQTNSNPMAEGKAAFVIEASHWRPGVQVLDLGYVDVKDSERPLNVERKRARTMMDGLLDGMMPTFTRKAWFSDERVRVSLSSINFNKVYDTYLQCISSLLPVNFRQVEKTRVHFEVDKAVLLQSDKRNLDRVIMYVKADSSVTSIYVDGHTDSSGRPIYNRRLSKFRAEVVTQYLVKEGLEGSMIQTRYHGERYPVVKNSTTPNKAKNRRSTVRLVRGEQLSLPTEEAPEGVIN
jgi:outer membrane protein OmpA-like peptidoglycan-associated protein